MMELENIATLVKSERDILSKLRAQVKEEFELISTNALAPEVAAKTSAHRELLVSLSECEKARAKAWGELLSELELPEETPSSQVVAKLGAKSAALAAAVAALRLELDAYVTERAALGETYKRAAGNAGLLWRFLQRAFGPEGVLRTRARTIDGKV